MLKKIIKIISIVFLLLVAFAFAAPFIFKGKIIALAKEQINQKLNAKVDFSDISLSFFRHFPQVAASMSNLQVIGKDVFAVDTLFSAKNIDISLNLMSVIKGSDFKIHAINIEQPRIHAVVTKDGLANWDIMKPDSSSNTSSSSQKPFQLTLDAYSISNGYLKYEDAASNMSSEIINLNHSGKGDFTSDLFTLVTKTTADEVSFSYGNIPYLSKVKTSVDANIEVDNKTKKYSFNTDQIHLNDLGLKASGFFQFLNDSVYNMDIQYNAPSTDFKNILSLVPIIYQKNFASIKTSGEALFNGFVKGQYSSTQMPAYNLNLDVKNGFFQYPDLPKPVRNINLALKIDNPDGITDHTVVDISKGHIEMDNEPFDFRLLLKTPISDMFIDAAAKGKLDLSQISQMVKLEPGTTLRGLLNADLSASGYLSAIEKKQYEKFNAAGTLNLTDFFYASKSYPDGVKLNSLLASFNPRNVSLSNLSGQYLKTNFTANASLDNLLPYVLKNKTLSGTATVKADQMNLNDWMGTSTDTSAKSSASSAAFAVPANIDFTINAGVDKVHYDKVDMQNLSGQLIIKDETVTLNNIKTNALDGSIGINGTYSTKESKTKPSISLAYDVKDLDVQKTFNAFNTVQKLMPIGKFIAGKISSHLSFTGKLGDNMMPDLNSLTGNGNLLLIEGFLNKFAPLEKLASTLNIKELDAISVKDIKNYIEFANGKVLVKPFTVKLKDIDMEIGGMHGFDQSLDYVIDMKVPRSLLGSGVNSLVNSLTSQASNNGVPIKLSDIINLKINMGGTISKPVIKTSLKEAAGSLADDLKKQAADFAKAKIDSAKTAISSAMKDTIASLKKQALQTAGDELKKQLLGKPDSINGATDVKTKAVESAKGLLDNINPFNKKKKANTDTTKH
ncbi:MAG: hypothetical protein JST58_17535 [Bacteroidetes bacterium]|nr:hypothetical protein [Bacteroidota bacterium]